MKQQKDDDDDDDFFIIIIIIFIEVPNKAKYQYLIRKLKNKGLKYIQIICRMSIKILKSMTQTENVMC